MNPGDIFQSIVSFLAIQIATLWGLNDDSMMKGKLMGSYTSTQFLNFFYNCGYCQISICVTFFNGIKLLQHHMEMFACDLGHLSASQITGSFLWKLSSSGMWSAVCLLRVSIAAYDLRQQLTHLYLQKPV